MDIFEEFLSCTLEERCNVAVNSADKLTEFFRKSGMLNDKEGEEFLVTFIAVLMGQAIGADGVITPNEAKVFNAVFDRNLTPKELNNFVSSACEIQSLESVDNIVDSLPEEQKQFVAYIILAVISADGDIDEIEKKYIYTIVG
jgi:uncharacterized tellurite resistance protein B-like protein